MRRFLRVYLLFASVFIALRTDCPAQSQQQAPPMSTASLARTFDWGIFAARLFGDSDKISFRLETSWIPGENRKGSLRYKLFAFPESGNLDKDVHQVAAREELMQRVSHCFITLQLYDAHGFILRKISATFSLGLDDRGRINSLTANDAVQMDAHSYRQFVGTSNSSGAWNLSWDCGPLQDQLGGRNTKTEKSANEEDSKEQTAIELLRAIADGIKNCKDYEPSPPPGQSDVRISAPLNVSWDTERSDSARTPLIGYVEFVQSFTPVHTPSVLEQCKNNDSACKRRNLSTRITDLDMEAHAPPTSQVVERYEFDVGDRELEFVRALRRKETEPKVPWQASRLNGCTGKAVLSVMGDTKP